MRIHINIVLLFYIYFVVFDFHLCFKKIMMYVCLFKKFPREQVKINHLLIIDNTIPAFRYNQTYHYYYFRYDIRFYKRRINEILINGYANVLSNENVVLKTAKILKMYITRIEYCYKLLLCV